MKTFTTMLSTAAILASLGLVAPAFSEAKKQTILLIEVDPVVLATGWRASDIVGARVYDDAGVDIGKLEDMIITSSDTVPYAVVSVGGFLGMNAHQVVVPATALELIDKKLTLHGATKESLKALPNFEFAS
jgi:sporulation protein YlmC with PRC-barrel domain